MSTIAANAAVVARRDFVKLRNLPPDEFYADSFTYAAEAEARVP